MGKSGLYNLFSGTNHIRKDLEKRRKLLYGIAYSWCHNPALADDLVQETMLKAFRNAKQLKNTDAMNGWLRRFLQTAGMIIYEDTRKPLTWTTCPMKNMQLMETPMKDRISSVAYVPWLLNYPLDRGRSSLWLILRGFPDRKSVV